MLEAEGKSTDIVWKILHQLPGKRKAAGSWADFFAEKLLLYGFERCEAYPEFSYHRSREVGIEVHMDDAHGFGNPVQRDSFLA